MELYVDGHNLEHIVELEYIIVRVKMNAWGTKMIFDVDDGNKVNAASKITNSRGQEIQFVSESDLMNHMFACGFEFVQTYFMRKGTGEINNRFVFRRMLRKNESI